MTNVYTADRKCLLPFFGGNTWFTHILKNGEEWLTLSFPLCETDEDKEACYKQAEQVAVALNAAERR